MRYYAAATYGNATGKLFIDSTASIIPKYIYIYIMLFVDVLNFVCNHLININTINIKVNMT